MNLCIDGEVGAPSLRGCRNTLVVGRCRTAFCIAPAERRLGKRGVGAILLGGAVLSDEEHAPRGGPGGTIGKGASDHSRTLTIDLMRRRELLRLLAGTAVV